MTTTLRSSESFWASGSVGFQIRKPGSNKFVLVVGFRWSWQRGAVARLVAKGSNLRSSLGSWPAAPRENTAGESQSQS